MKPLSPGLWVWGLGDDLVALKTVAMAPQCDEGNGVRSRVTCRFVLTGHARVRRRRRLRALLRVEDFRRLQERHVQS